MPQVLTALENTKATTNTETRPSQAIESTTNPPLNALNSDLDRLQKEMSQAQADLKHAESMVMLEGFECIR